MPGCAHETRQVGSDLFECIHCGMIFPGIDRNIPGARNMIDILLRGGDLRDYLHRSSNYSPTPPWPPGHPGDGYPTTVKHVDLGPVPNQIEELKIFVIKQEEALQGLRSELSRFADILKIAVER